MARKGFSKEVTCELRLKAMKDPDMQCGKVNRNKLKYQENSFIQHCSSYNKCVLNQQWENRYFLFVPAKNDPQRKDELRGDATSIEASAWPLSSPIPLLEDKGLDLQATFQDCKIGTPSTGPGPDSSLSND